MQGFLVFAVFVAGAVAQTFPPSIVVHPPAETVATETKTVRFTCAAYGLPLPTIKWGKENGEIVPDSNSGFQIFTQTMKFGPTTFAVSVLEISGVDATTAGQFVCFSDNGIAGVGLSESFATFSLVVDSLDKEPAVLLEVPSSQTVDHGSTVEAVCVAYGNPLPTISWSKVVSCDDGLAGECTRDVTDIIYSDVATYGDTALNKSVLQLCNVSRDNDAGIYRCTAWNDVGGVQMSIDSSDWNLFVNLPAIVTQAPTSTDTSCEATVRTGAGVGAGSDVQPYQIVVGIMAVAIVVLIVAVVVLVLLYIKSKAANSAAIIAGDESKVDNPIYSEPPDIDINIDHKTLIN